MKTKVIIIAFIVIFLAQTGCVRYAYKKPDCELVIWSMREINAANVVIGKDCELTGGAAGMTYNETQMEVFKNLVNKIP